MKKAILLFVFSTSLSLFAAANNGIKETTTEPNPKNPKKKQEQSTTPSFSLADGYFSLFNLFLFEDEPVDTLRKKVMPPTFKPGAIHK